MKKSIYLILLVIAALMAGCVNDDITEQDTNSTKATVIVANAPGSADSRVSYSQDDKNYDVLWEANDFFYAVGFSDGATTMPTSKYKFVKTNTDVGKQATFKAQKYENNAWVDAQLSENEEIHALYIGSDNTYIRNFYTSSTMDEYVYLPFSNDKFKVYDTMMGDGVEYLYTGLFDELKNVDYMTAIGTYKNGELSLSFEHKMSFLHIENLYLEGLNNSSYRNYYLYIGPTNDYYYSDAKMTFEKGVKQDRIEMNTKKIVKYSADDVSIYVTFTNGKASANMKGTVPDIYIPIFASDNEINLKLTVYFNESYSDPYIYSYTLPSKKFEKGHIYKIKSLTLKKE